MRQHANLCNGRLRRDADERRKWPDNKYCHRALSSRHTDQDVQSSRMEGTTQIGAAATVARLALHSDSHFYLWASPGLRRRHVAFPPAGNSFAASADLQDPKEVFFSNSRMAQPPASFWGEIAPGRLGRAEVLKRYSSHWMSSCAPSGTEKALRPSGVFEVSCMVLRGRMIWTAVQLISQQQIHL